MEIGINGCFQETLGRLWGTYQTNLEFPRYITSDSPGRTVFFMRFTATVDHRKKTTDLRGLQSKELRVGKQNAEVL
jgi:hypothetical protein